MKCIRDFSNKFGRLMNTLAVGNLLHIPSILRAELQDAGAVLCDVTSNKSSAADIAIISKKHNSREKKKIIICLDFLISGFFPHFFFKSFF